MCIFCLLEMASDLILRAVLTDYDVGVTKEQVTTIIPNSIIGQQVTLDPTVEMIEFILPIITPTILDFVRTLLAGDIPTLSPDTNYVDAMNYLGIDLGLLISFDMSPVGITSATEAKDYGPAMDGGIVKNATWKLLFLMQKFRPDLTKQADKENLKTATEVGRLDVVNWMLFRGVDPTFDNNVAIQMAAQQGYDKIIDRLLADPRVDPTAMNNMALSLAVQFGGPKAVIRLLQDPRVRQKSDLGKILRLSSGAGRIDVLNLFFNDPNITKDMIYDALTAATG